MSSTLSTVTNDADGATPGTNGILIPTHIDNIPIKYDGNPASIPAVLHELELWTLRTGHFKDLIESLSAARWPSTTSRPVRSSGLDRAANTRGGRRARARASGDRGGGHTGR